MTSIADIRKKLPDLAGLDDDQVVDVVQQVYYPSRSRDEVAQRLGHKTPAAAQEPSGLARRVLGDSAVSLVKGAIGVPEAAVGIADLVTGGRAGQAAESVGFRPKEARAILDEFYSPEQRADNAEVQQAEGFIDTATAAIQNPSTIAQAVVESAPSLLPAGAVARGVMKAAPKVGGAVAAGLGEGVVSAGQTAAQVRQESADGLLSGEQAGIAATSGALTGVLGAVAGKVANRLGIGDLNQLIAGVRTAGPEARKGVVRSIVEGFATEGVLQELPQSAQEQVAQNLALGRPWDEGVGNAAAMGALAGGAMGGVAGPLGRPSPADAVRAQKLPETGSLTKAVNAGIEAQAAAVEAGPTGPQPMERFNFKTQEQAAAFAASFNPNFVPTQRGDGGWSFVERDPLPTEQTEGTAEEVETGLVDRLQMLKEDLAKPETMAALREVHGAAGARDLLQVLSAVESGQLPARTAERMLAGAERRLASVRMEIIPPEDAAAAQPALAAPEQPLAPLALGMEPAPAAIEYAQSPTGTIRVDSAGQAVPETEADAINSRQAAGEQVDLGSQARRASAVFADPAPAAPAVPIEAAAPAAPAALTYDTAPTGRMIAGDDGVRTETRAEAINRSQERQQRAELGLTPDVERASMRAALGNQTQDGDILTAGGFPFRNRRAAQAAAARAGAGFAPVEIAPDSFVVRQAAQAQGEQTADVPQLDQAAQEAAPPPAAQAAEIRTEAGQPFKSKAVAARQAKLNPGYSLAEVDGGWVLRKESDAGPDAGGSGAGGRSDAGAVDAPGSVADERAGQRTAAGTGPGAQVVDSPDGSMGADDDAVKRLSGKSIDKEWTAFAADSGTLAIPRAEMPQIKAVHRGAMVNFLAARGIKHEQAEVPAADLKPTQAEFSPSKVKAAKDFDSDRSILVSSDGHVLDGHHQWMSKLEAGEAVKVIRLDAPIARLLEEVKEFPSAEASGGAGAAAPKREAVAASGSVSRAGQTPPKTARVTAAPGGAKIDDFGEKLHGARKDYATTLSEAMDVDVAAEPLSKSWPEPDYQKLLDGGADPFVVAWVHAARDEIPTKPVKGWKLSGWVESVKSLRGAASDLLSGAVTAQDLKDKLLQRDFHNAASKVGGRAELYQAVGHEKSLKGVNFEEHHYSIYRGEANVRKWSIDQRAKSTAFSNWPRELAVANTKAEALELFKKRFAELDLGPKAKKQPQFVIYRKRGEPGAFIGKKIGRENIDLKKLPDLAAARQFLVTGAAELEAALSKYKETPLERNAENQPRVGDDHRGGALVTPEVFAETFGFRGVQFGNYVEQGRRQSDLNQTFDALMDLAAVLGIPAKSLSLNGRLGLAFGARGKGGTNAPAAHFEPDTVVINLTKGGGPGSLAHEWWHALDNYLARQSGAGGFVTGGAKTDKLRLEMQRAFQAVTRATQHGALRKRSAELDKRRTKPYWNTPVELSARSFESYVIAKLVDQNAANDYLANVVSPESWEAVESMRADALGQPVAPSYPYPLADEMPGLRATMDEFFQTIETKTDDAGNVSLYSRGQPEDVPRVEAAELREKLAKVIDSWRSGPAGGVTIVQSVADLPGAIRDGLKAVDAEGTVRALFRPKSQSVYLIADNLGSVEEAQFALLHEVYGHLGLRSLLGRDYADTMITIRRANKRLAVEAEAWFLQNGMAEIRERMGRGMKAPDAQRQVALLAVEEALADRAGRNETISSWRWLAAKIQKALRAAGLNHVADWMENKTQAEVMDLLRQARAAVHGRGVAPAPSGEPEMAMSRDDAPVLSRKPAQVVQQLAPQMVRDMISGQRDFKRMHWWHKTVGTMYDLAQKNPVFRQVFDSAQNYIQDVSFFANDAADQAPRVLPQLNTLGDLKKALTLPEVDRAAIQAPIFEGTLNWTRDDAGKLVETDDVEAAGVVFTAEELAERFKLSERQIELYREFRAAVDRSLDSTMAGDLIRYLGKDAPDGAKDLARAGEFRALRDMVLAHIETMPAGKLQTEIREEVNQKLERLESLKARGYAPLMRFGKFAVRVVGPNDESKFFGLYESGAEAARAARLLGEDPQFKGDRITRGVMSQEDFKLLKGLSPETLGLFASITGTDQNEAMQLWLKQATSNRSALKRLIKRKGIEGYSEDVSRVLSSFITSNARGASQGLHFGEMQELVSEIKDGDVKDAAVRLRDYVQNPTEEAAGLRGFLFVNFIGGSLASAAVNITQPFMMTMPYLSRFVGIPGAGRIMASSLKQVLPGATLDDDMKTALAIAEKEGIVSPQELHQLQAMAMGRGSLLGQAGRFFGANDQLAGQLDAAGKRAMFLWGAPFSLAEQFNRRLTFIAAYQVAKEKGNADPFAFAAQAVVETQGLYNRANRPEWARGAIGATLFTFKQYSISYLEFMKRMWMAGEPGSQERTDGRKAALFGIALLVIAAGAQGIPGADDLDDLIDTIGQRMGHDTSAKRWKQENLPAWLNYGFSALPGIPLDVAGRLGIGNLLPGTGLLRMDKSDKSGDVWEIAGAAGGVAKGVLAAAETGSVKPMLPVAIQNLLKGLDIAQHGAYRDTKGRRVIDADNTDAAFKAIGFQPATVAAASRADGLRISQQTLARNTEASIAGDWAAARFEGDVQGEADARKRLADWNATNPNTPIAISFDQINKRVRQMRMTRAERINKTATKELRAVGAG